MADDLTPAPDRRSRRRHGRTRGFAKPAALAVFALLVTLGPLAFGAVDRIVQIGLAALLGVGMLLVPPRILALPPWLGRVVLVLAAALVFKELAPADWFGTVSWRTTIEQSFAVALPWTHHPEPGRALDGWLAAGVAVGWFAWVRTLASEHEDRARLAWAVFLGAAVVAAVSFATVRDAESKMIFGLREAPGWLGFGPFPNRNHSACFFAMAAILGAGCLARAGGHKRFAAVAVGVAAMGGIVLALLRTQSRGGVIALGAGLAVFLAVVLLKLRSRKALAVALAAALLVGGLGLLAGGRTLHRFAGTGQALDVSASTRVAVWKDAAVMWRDAPLLGHGLGEFTSIFPMYQQVALEEVMVKHPESSLLQWLTELGLLPVLLGALAAIGFSLPHVGAIFERQSGFHIRAAGFGAAAVLLTHAIFDVPAHRWGTAGIALAALALACPARGEGQRSTRLAALVPLGVAGFWLLPIWIEWPRWSTFQLDRTISALDVPPGLPRHEIDATLRWFPLNAQLHLARAERALRAANPPAGWQNELRIATRLVPSSWKVCARAARLCRPVQPSLALHYWQLAIERATRERVDVFGTALAETRGVPGAEAVWMSYAEAQPGLALLLCEGLGDEEGRRYYELWWQQRGSREADIPGAEAAAFLRAARRWGTPAQLASWMQRHPGRGEAEFRAWASLLHAWGEDERAWALLRRAIPEPQYPGAPPLQSREELDYRWRHTPEDIVNARTLAHRLELNGADEAAEQIILAVAARSDAPKWFLDKAAWQLAKRNDLVRAVEFALRQPPPAPH